MDELIKKYLTGSINSDEQMSLLLWLRKSGNLEVFRIEQAKWKNTIVTEVPQVDVKKGMLRLQGVIMEDMYKKEMYIRYWQKLYKYSAIFLIGLLLVGGVLFLDNKNTKSELAYFDVSAVEGSVSVVELPDSTKVWLNSGSVLTYNGRYGSDNRTINLKGEAYFDVTSNKDLPFLVEGELIRVKVLGTKFLINNYSDSKLTSVMLEEGSVELALLSESDNTICLKPGERFLFDALSDSYLIDTVRVDRYSSWRKGILSFYETSMGELGIILERRFNTTFKIDHFVKDIKITVQFKDESLSEILQIIETICPVKIISERDCINIQPR